MKSNKTTQQRKKNSTTVEFFSVFKKFKFAFADFYFVCAESVSTGELAAKRFTDSTAFKQRRLVL